MTKNDQKRAPISRAEIDRRIIAAFLEEDDPALEEVVPGLSAADIRRRAVEIGLSRALVRDSRLSGDRLAMRACVRCDARFLSVGPQNRLCRACSRRDT
ncbi:MAG: hypothetical protein KC420_11365 [Myxococcales bacterium]|nr:hypothetical protein [Myxococcales bacterium]MCB9703774.1 hypothetical protein [Myxococcales bacterium]